MKILLEHCYQLEKKGKKPSVAMLKKFAGSEHPLKVIIETITKWNSFDEQQKQHYASVTPIEPVTASAQPSLSLEARVTALENQLINLQKELDSLKQSHT